jgi:arylsulfatase A-like enzyme
MGGKAPAEVQGASLLPSLARKELPTVISYGETLYPKINMGWAELRAIRTNRWKYICAPKRELYDLSQNPAERHNIIESHAAVDPDLASAQLNLGLLYKMAGDHAHALACFETFLVMASSAQYGAIIPKIRRELASVR